MIENAVIDTRFLQFACAKQTGDSLVSLQTQSIKGFVDRLYSAVEQGINSLPAVPATS